MINFFNFNTSSFILFALFILLFLFIYFRYRYVYRSLHQTYLRKTIDYDNALQTLKTGDLVLFSYRAKNPFLRWPIKLYQSLLLGSEWTHVGLIVESNGIPYIAESTAKENNLKKYGYADLNPLLDRLKSYQGRIAFRKLNRIINNQDQARLIKYIKSTQGIPFEENLEKHIIHNCILKNCHKCQNIFAKVTKLPERMGYFCTEYVQILMKKAGIIDVNKYKVADNCSMPLYFTDLSSTMKFRNGYQYGPEIDFVKE